MYAKEIGFLKKLSQPKCNPFVICYYGSSYYEEKIDDKEKIEFLIEMEYVEGEEMMKFLDQKKVDTFFKTYGYNKNAKWFTNKKDRLNTIDKLIRTDVKKLLTIDPALTQSETNKLLSDAKTFDKDYKEYYYYLLLLIAKDLAAGLEYIHSKKIIHNDIKLENIMIDKTNTPRIIDFGLSCTSTKINSLGHCQIEGMTSRYAPPEYYNYEHDRYTVSDMWALGVTLYKAATGIFPYTYLYIIREKLLSKDPPPKLETSNQLLNDVVNGLLIKDFHKRLTAKQLSDKLLNIPKYTGKKWP